MGAPIAPWIVRWLILKGGSKAVGKYTARSHSRRMAKKAAHKSTRRRTKVTPFAPAPQGPYARRKKVQGRSSQSSQQNGSPWAPNGGTRSRRRGPTITPRGPLRGVGGRRLRRKGPGRPRRPKTLPYRRGGCPTGYRYDPVRKMCVRT